MYKYIDHIKIQFDINFSGFVEKKNTEDYKLHREKYVKKGRNNANFRRAVSDMDDFITDSKVGFN